jgi:hypothetical protein
VKRNDAVAAAIADECDGADKNKAETFTLGVNHSSCNTSFFMRDEPFMVPS